MPRYTDHHLLDAAGYSFRRYGYFKTRMEGIAAQVPCSKVTLYRYFPDKPALAEAWLDMKMEASRRRMETLIGDSRPFDARVAEMIRGKQEDLNDFGEPFLRDLFSPACPESLRQSMSRQTALNKRQTLLLMASGRSCGAVHPNLNDELIQVLLDHFEKLFVDPAFLDLVPEPQRVGTLVGLFLHGLALTSRATPEVNHD